MTTSDTLIGQALVGASPGGLRRGWETSLEAERPGAGSAAAAPQLRRNRLNSSRSGCHPRSHNTLRFRLPAAVPDP